jgi:hypothetical protein
MGQNTSLNNTDTHRLHANDERAMDTGTQFAEQPRDQNTAYSR